MSPGGTDIRSAAQADAQEHGVTLRLESDGGLTANDTAGTELVREGVSDAVHSALHGVALAQVDASEVIVWVGHPHDRKVDVDAHLKE
jgi:hypothetical protein